MRLLLRNGSDVQVLDRVRAPFVPCHSFRKEYSLSEEAAEKIGLFPNFLIAQKF